MGLYPIPTKCSANRSFQDEMALGKTVVDCCKSFAYHQAKQRNKPVMKKLNCTEIP